MFLQLVLYYTVEPERVNINQEWIDRIRNTKVCKESDGGVEAALERAFSNLIINYIG